MGGRVRTATAFVLVLAVIVAACDSDVPPRATPAAVRAAFCRGGSADGADVTMSLETGTPPDAMDRLVADQQRHCTGVRWSAVTEWRAERGGFPATYTIDLRSGASDDDRQVVGAFFRRSPLVDRVSVCCGKK